MKMWIFLSSIVIFNKKIALVFFRVCPECLAHLESQGNQVMRYNKITPQKLTIFPEMILVIDTFLLNYIFCTQKFF